MRPTGALRAPASAQTAVREHPVQARVRAAASRRSSGCMLTDPYGYFETPVSFPSSGNVRISWSYPRGMGGGQIHSRTVAIAIR